jgi:protein-tyrosine phosphatase
MFQQLVQPIDAHRIAPGLWMGAAPPLGNTLASSGFDILVLCAAEHQPLDEYFPGVVVMRAHLHDDGKTPFTPVHALEAARVASQVARAIKLRARVLVTCWEGRNRSGLVTALALTELTGCSGIDACRAVRFRRLPKKGHALVNQDFLDALFTIPAAVVKGAVTQNAAVAAGLAG